MNTKYAYSTSEAAKQLGVSFRTLKSWIYSGKIKTFKTPTNQHRILAEELQKIIGGNPPNKTAIYTRVSSTKQREDLDRQSERMLQYCTEHGHNIIIQLSEIASGLNDSRTKLHKLLEMVANKEINHIVVEHSDRLTRFGFKYLEQYCSSYNCIIEIVNPTEHKDDLVKDLIDIVTCFCAKLYGKRSSKNKTTQKVTECLKDLKVD